MTEKATTKKKKIETLIVLSDCNVHGLGKLTAGAEYTGSDIIKVKEYITPKHYRIVRK